MSESDNEIKTAEAPKLTLAQKINAVTAAIPKIKMTGVNTHDNYKYLKIEDVVDAVRKEMQKQELILTPQILRIENIPDTKGILRDVDVEWCLEDAGTGEKRCYRVPGTGWDYHDKGTYKALTGSRKYALILIFNLPVGDNPEQTSGTVETSKAAAKTVAANKIAAAAAAGNKTAIDAMSQAEPEKKLIITRPEEYNGHYLIASGYIAVPQLDTFFNDTGCKRIDSKKTGKTGWKVPAEYEKGLLAMCERLNLEVEG